MTAQSKIEAAAVPAVYGAIVAVMAEVGAEGIAKGRKNEQQGYKFRGIDEVFNTLNGILAKHKLVMLPRVQSRTCEERKARNGGALFYTFVDVEFDMVCAVDGSTHTIRTVGEAMDSADKSSNKAQSAAYKYAALQAFCIPTEGDNDADATTHDVEPREERRPRPETGSADGSNGKALGKGFITEQQRDVIQTHANASGVTIQAICERVGIDNLLQLHSDSYEPCLKWIKKQGEPKQQPQQQSFETALDDEVPY